MDALLEIVNQEVDAAPDSVEITIDQVIARAKRETVFGQWSDDLIRKGVANLVYGVRHERNVVMRQQNGDYGTAAKVTAGEATARVVRSVYQYMIAGKSLGSVTGEELPDIADAESARAGGHEFNARLCRQLAKSVKGEKTVRECVSETKLKRIFGAVEK